VEAATAEINHPAHSLAQVVHHLEHMTVEALVAVVVVE
jgi:hypothetical protein